MANFLPIPLKASVTAYQAIFLSFKLILCFSINLTMTKPTTMNLAVHLTRILSNHVPSVTA